MNEKTTHEQHAYICTLLEEKRLKEAFMQLESLLWQCPEWELRTRLEQLQTSYTYMLDYMRQGINDPARWEVYQKLIADTWEIADQARLLILDTTSSRHYHRTRHTLHLENSSTDSLQKITHRLESFDDDLSISSLLSDKKTDEVLKLHEDALKDLFTQTWVNSAWTPQEKEQAQAMLRSKSMSIHDLSLFVSAVTLSAMECFDLHKVMWLLDAYSHPHVQVNQRAMVGILLIFHTHSKRLNLYQPLVKRMEMMEDVDSFREDAARIYRQLLLCQETEKVDKKMREEIIPEMIKGASSITGIRFNNGENDEENNDKNPDWTNIFEQSGISSKLREMNELQQEGADIYMSTFSLLKNAPFFREQHNWLYPFSEHHSLVQKALREQPENSRTNLLNLILKTGFFCNSDQYSFFFTVQHFPVDQQQMILGQFSEQQAEDLENKEFSIKIQQHACQPSTVSNQYLHDLYRFFKLSGRKLEFRDVFKEKINLHHIPALHSILLQQDVLFLIADFYLKKERWENAGCVFEEMDAIDAFKGCEVECYQKWGYAFQKRKMYAEAIQAYTKADTLKPDSIWTNRHLATCCRLNQSYKTALAYYKKVEEVEPEDKNVIFYIGSCLTELEQYEEALNYFFKLDFMENNSKKAWRGIGWCSFILNKNEQAMRYYEKVIQKKPLPIDFMNAGHVAWVMGDIQKTIGFYNEAINSCQSRQAFLEMFQEDEEALLKQGIRKEDIPLLLDAL